MVAQPSLDPCNDFFPKNGNQGLFTFLKPSTKIMLPSVTKGYNNLNLAIDFDMLSVENLTFPWHGDRRLKMCLTKLNGHNTISICFLWFSTFLNSSVIISSKGKWIRVCIYICMYRLWEHLLSWSCLKKWNPVHFGGRWVTNVSTRPYPNPPFLEHVQVHVQKSHINIAWRNVEHIYII